MAKLSQWKLRRLAPRALQTYERHKEASPWVFAYDTSLVVSAARVIELYDEVHALGTTKTSRSTEAESASAALLRELRGWVHLVSLHVPKVSRGDYGDRPNVPDDVISDVLQLIAAVSAHEQDTGNTLPFSDVLRTSLTEALQAAQKEWGDSSTLNSAFAAKRLELRRACLAFHRDLIAFRAALENLLGRSHPDYQKLRMKRIRVVDADDDEVGASLPEAGTDMSPDVDDDDTEDQGPAAEGDVNAA